VKAIGFKQDGLCTGCITGKYPTPLAQKIADDMKMRFLQGFEEKERLYEMEEAVQEASCSTN
jgi:hypothetical protein